MDHPKQVNTSETTLGALIAWLWHRRKIIVVTEIVAVVGAVAYSLLATPYYKATSFLLPQDARQVPELIGQLQMMSGFNFLSQGSNEELYGKIVESDVIIDKVVNRKWRFKGFTEPVDLYDIFDIDRDDMKSKERFRRYLRNDVLKFYRDKQTGYMEISALVPKDPEFAAEFTNYVVDELDAFNQQVHARKAQEHRIFIEEQEAQSRLVLKKSEDDLAAFVQSNRTYATSPQLQLEYNRLSRIALANSEIWMQLRTQFELAKIEEHKNLVSVTVLSPAVPPAQPYTPRLALNTLLAAILGGIICVLLLIIRDQVAEKRS